MEDKNQDLLNRLSPRETEVFRHLVADRSITEIAEIMNVKKATVETHKRSIQGKLNTNSPIQFLKIALSEGLLDQNLSLKKDNDIA